MYETRRHILVTLALLLIGCCAVIAIGLTALKWLIQPFWTSILHISPDSVTKIQEIIDKVMHFFF